MFYLNKIHSFTSITTLGTIERNVWSCYCPRKSRDRVSCYYTEHQDTCPKELTLKWEQMLDRFMCVSLVQGSHYTGNSVVLPEKRTQESTLLFWLHCYGISSREPAMRTRLTLLDSVDRGVCFQVENRCSSTCRFTDSLVYTEQCSVHSLLLSTLRGLSGCFFSLCWVRLEGLRQ